MQSGLSFVHRREAVMGSSAWDVGHTSELAGGIRSNAIVNSNSSRSERETDLGAFARRRVGGDISRERERVLGNESFRIRGLEFRGCYFIAGLRDFLMFRWLEYKSSAVGNIRTG